MEAFKKNIEGTWKFIKGGDKNLEEFLKKSCISAEEADLHRNVQPLFMFQGKDNNQVESWNVPFPDKPDVKIAINFELGKKFEFTNPVNKNLTSMFMDMEGDKLLQIQEPVTDKNAKKTKTYFVRNGDTLECVTALMDDATATCTRCFSKV